MISRRDKLLVRPWEQRRYDYHRRKVQSALPAIDVGPPPNRVHVSYKLKKHQKEIERCDKIEKDNLILLQRLRSVMTSTRVDNNWTIAQPNFLNKVAIYDTNNKLSYQRKESRSVSFDDKSRKGRCLACTPKKSVSPQVPEERIPWAPPKSPVSRKRSQSVPPRRVKICEEIPKKSSPQSLRTSSTASVRASTSAQTSSSSLRSRSQSRDKRKELAANSKSIVLSRGEMQLAVSFPVDTVVKLKNGSKDRFLIDGKNRLCHCKAMNEVIKMRMIR